MKKWFYAFMWSLMVIFGMVGCASNDDAEDSGKASEPTPIHITIPKMRRSNFTEDIDTISIVDESGELLYECDTDNEVSIRLNDGKLVVIVPLFSALLVDVGLTHEEENMYLPGCNIIKNIICAYVHVATTGFIQSNHKYIAVETGGV